MIRKKIEKKETNKNYYPSNIYLMKQKILFFLLKNQTNIKFLNLEYAKKKFFFVLF